MNGDKMNSKKMYYKIDRLDRQIRLFNDAIDAIGCPQQRQVYYMIYNILYRVYILYRGLTFTALISLTNLSEIK